MSEPLLRTRGLTKAFGGLTAVDSVDFELYEDQLTTLIGPNGAGKTTFFNLLTGTLEPTSGTVEFRDGAQWTDLTGAAPYQVAQAGIHRSYQITNIFPQLTVKENVRLAAQAHGGTDSWRLYRNVDSFDTYIEEAEQILDRVGLREHATKTATTLSHGQKRNLEIGLTLAGDPDVILLDEPAAGVSSDGLDEIVDLVADIGSDHAVLLVEHNIDLVMELSDRVTVLHQGELIADDEPAAVRNDEAVQKAYLGGYETETATQPTDA